MNKSLYCVSTALILGLLSIHPASAEEAYFSFDYPPALDTFVFKLTDPLKIQKARDILSGKQTSEVHVTGRILKKPASYNPGWSFHIDPATIQFFPIDIEVCDAEFRYVEEHLDVACGAFLPGCVWCPWGSRLLEEIKP